MNDQDILLVKKIASLAKLGIDDSDAPSLALDMKNMMNFAAPTTESGCFAIERKEAETSLRADEPKDSCDRSLLLSGSGASNGEFFAVVRVVAGGDGNE